MASRAFFTALVGYTRYFWIWVFISATSPSWSSLVSGTRQHEHGQSPWSQMVASKTLKTISHKLKQAEIVPLTSRNNLQNMWIFSDRCVAQRHHDTAQPFHRCACEWNCCQAGISRLHAWVPDNNGSIYPFAEYPIWDGPFLAHSGVSQEVEGYTRDALSPQNLVWIRCT